VNPRMQALLDQIRGAWRFRWPAVAVATLVAFLGWAVIFSLADSYEAASQVLIDSRSALKPALQGLAAENDVAIQLNYVQQSLLVDEQLCKLAMQAGVLKDCAADLQAAQPRLANLRSRIKIVVANIDQSSYQPDQNNVNVKVTYRDTDQNHALQLVSGLMNAFETQTLGGKRAGSENAQKFLASQLEESQARVRAFEAKLEDFKARHVGMLPDEDGGYIAQLQKEIKTADDLETKLLAAENRRATLTSQLHATAATATAPITLSSTGGLTAVDTASQIIQLQAQLDELLLKYTEKHPDVIAARAQLADLRKRRAAEIQGAQHGDAGSVTTSGAAANPVYQSIQLQLNQTDVDIAESQSDLSQHRAKVAQLRTLLTTEPQVETEFGQLTRDYEGAKAEYTTLQAGYDKSTLSEQADVAGNTRFRIVQRPTVSDQPVSPRRPLLLSAVLILALAAGGGLAYWLDQMQPVVGSSGALAQLTGVPVLVAVGTAFPIRSRKIFRRELRHLSVAVGALVCALILGQMLSSAGVRLSVPAIKHMVKTWVS
jgi:polysaccharide chain length determinant protein (PEP-CTERM system associated)